MTLSKLPANMEWMTKPFEGSADYISIDVEPAKKDVVSAPKFLTNKHDVAAEDIAKKISEYFEDYILNYKNPARGNRFCFLRKLCKCEYWLIEQYSTNNFELLGYGDYVMFLEKYMHLLPHALQRCIIGDISENVSLEAHLLPIELDVLLSQALNSLWENETMNVRNISHLLARQFPLVCFKLMNSEHMPNFLDLLQEKRCSLPSNTVLFSAPLLRLNYMGDVSAQDEKKVETSGFGSNMVTREGIIAAVTTKDAIDVLLKAPMLTDLNLWSHWDILFAPSLGSMVEWLLKEVNTEELLCLVTKGGKVIRLDPSATLDSFLKVFIQGSSFETAVALLSLYALYGGERNVPLSLLKCHARQAFEVIINNYLEMELHYDKNPYKHGKTSYDQHIVGKSASSNLSGKLRNNRSILNKAATVMSRFTLDCLSYLPIEFCSFAADVLIAGLQPHVDDVPSVILAECKQIEQRLMLHEVGMSLGLMEWVHDYNSFCSSPTTGFSPGSSCLDVVNCESNKRSVIGQGELYKDPSSSGEMLVSCGVDRDDLKVKQVSGGADSSDGQVANSERLSSLDNHIDNDPSKVIESIRQEEFGLDQSLSATEIRMLEKQHARLGRALHCLSQELYSQDSHFLLELVQNADDNIYPGDVEPTLIFILHEKGIIVLNNEQGFSANNIRALCDVGNSTKKGHNAGYIGKKGIGFKSVFRVTDAPEIHSNGFHIKFDITEGQIGFVLPTVVPPCDIDLYTRLASADAGSMDQNCWKTCIVLPFRSNLSEGFALNNILSMFTDLHPSLLLFLHRLRCIKFKNILDDSLIVMRKEVQGDGLVEVALGNEKMTWFVVSQKLKANVIRSDVQTTEISIAFTLQEKGDGGYVPILDQQPVFAFLPLRTYGLKFILQGDFVLPSSREEVDGNSPWNQWLLSEYPNLFVSAERSFCDLPCYRGSPGKAVTAFMSFIPLAGEVHGFFSSLPRMVISKLRISNCLILEGDGQEWVPPCKVLRNWTEQTRSLLPDSLLHEHLGLGFLNKDIVLSDSLAKSLGVEDYGPKILLRVISSLCRTDNGLKSVGLSWLSSWLSTFYVMSSQSFMQMSASFGTESDFIIDLQKTPFIPLSDGKYGSLDQGTVWLHTEVVGQGTNDEWLLKAFPKLYGKLRIVSPSLLAAAASIESSSTDTTIVENVIKMLYKVGVQRLAVHDIVKVHILPAISDDKNTVAKEELMIEYLAFAMFHLQSSCATCSLERGDIIAELHEKALILTNYGYKRSNEVPIHFSREYGNPVDVNKLISGLDMKWHEVDSAYVKHPITKSMSGGVLKWRNFFQEIGVTDFVQVVQVEKSVSDMSLVNSMDIVCNKDIISSDSVVKNWESEELFHLLSWISSRDDGEKCKILLDILDRLWDDHFSDKITGDYVDSTGEFKPFKSSFISNLQHFPWMVSNINNKLHYPKDLFHDCVTVNSVLGVSAPYTVPKVKSEKLLSNLGLKTQVTLDDALSVLRLWRRCESPFRASVSQMSNFYAFLWKGMALSKKKIIEELHVGPFIFVPNTSGYADGDIVPGALLSPQDVYWHDNIGSLDRVKPVNPATIASSRNGKIMLYNLYPNLHEFFVDECGVGEGPPLCSYLEILLQLSTITLPHQAAKRVFEVFLMWDDALKSGSMSCEDVAYLKESLLKKEYTVLPTRQDKWVSLHASFGLICWCDDDNLGREFQHLNGVDFLYFGESADAENKMLQAKVSTIMQRLGIPALSEIVTREAIYYGPADCRFILSLVSWVLPYAQRYIHNAHPDKYFQLKQSGFENLRRLKIVVVEKLFYRNVIKKYKITLKKRHECNCLLQDNILYCSRDSDPHSIFLEFSCLLYNGTPELHFANFLHMITTMAESGATEEQTEFFILNSQKVPQLPAEESNWSLQSFSSSMENDGTQLENGLAVKVEEQNSAMFKKRSGINSNWPPVDWKTAPGFNSVGAFGSRKPGGGNFAEQNLGQTNISIEINSEFNIQVDPSAITEEVVSVAEEISQSQSNLSRNLVASSMNVVLDSVDLVAPDSKNVVPSNSSERDEDLAQQAKLTGRLGELVAFKYFQGKADEVFVKWVNEINETGLPYDITLGGDDDSREYIEVKATKSARKNWFLISMREWQFAVEKGESFSIAHVVLADNNMAKITIFKNPARLCQLVMPKKLLFQHNHPASRAFRKHNRKVALPFMVVKEVHIFYSPAKRIKVLMEEHTGSSNPLVPVTFTKCTICTDVRGFLWMS
ncbi:protein NO VEIN [Sesamum alatum]|uniref:Protein NO VEIN n=1 Tax=Sesamum alatum TaxID=300844 RepID=A0AAE1YNP9_9LAMI|nr:protein NO VEIN [Sesamum alatum]